MAAKLFSDLHNLVFNRCNSFLAAGSPDNYYKFVVDEYFVGFVEPHFVDVLNKYSEVFVFVTQSKHGTKCITLHPSLKNFDDRSAAVSKVMKDLRESSSLKALTGWRDEEYGVYVQNREKVLFTIERSVSCLLGIVRYGVHVNGYCLHHDHSGKFNGAVDKSDNINIGSELFMWIGKRALTKPTWPGLLDNMSAGGLTYGLNMMECARKECQEEASVPDNLLKNLRFVNSLSLLFKDDRGVFPEVLYCFDLELPTDYVPLNADGEVDNFKLVSMDDVKQLIFSDEFKPNSAVVVLDFLYRHNLMDMQSDPKHQPIQSMMHVELPFD